MPRGERSKVASPPCRWLASHLPGRRGGGEGLVSTGCGSQKLAGKSSLFILGTSHASGFGLSLTQVRSLVPRPRCGLCWARSSAGLSPRRRCAAESLTRGGVRPSADPFSRGLVLQGQRAPRLPSSSLPRASSCAADPVTLQPSWWGGGGEGCRCSPSEASAPLQRRGLGAFFVLLFSPGFPPHVGVRAPGWVACFGETNKRQRARPAGVRCLLRPRPCPPQRVVR